MSTKKISELNSLNSGNLNSTNDLLPIVNSGQTKKITVDNLLGNVGDITSTGDISGRSGSFDYISVTGGITASNLYLDENTLYIGGTAFSKSDVDNLKSGKPIATDQENMLVSAKDATTKIRTSTTGRMAFYAGNVGAVDIKRDKVVIGGIDGGSGGLPVVMPSSLSVTGSTSTSGSYENTGSFNSTGSFNVNNLLDLLANYGQTGIPTGSGEGGVAAGDINLDGQVNVNDMLLVLAGFGNPNQICTDQTIPPNVNHQYIGPTISICDGSTLTISAGSFCSITN